MDKVASASEPSAAAVRSAPAELLPKRGRGRPRKTLGERDDGNRRLELVRAAGRLFRRKGFDATSTRDIAAAVGMRSGSPFYHFKSKGALLCEVMRQGMEDASVRQAQALAALTQTPATAQVATTSAQQALQKTELPTHNPRALLGILIRNHFEILLGKGADFIPVMLYEWRSLNARQRKQIALIKDHYEAVWVPLLEALHASGQLRCEPKLARLFIFGALNWSAQWFDARQGASLDALAQAATDLFLAPVPASAGSTRRKKAL